MIIMELTIIGAVVVVNQCAFARFTIVQFNFILSSLPIRGGNHLGVGRQGRTKIIGNGRVNRIKLWVLGDASF